MTEVMVEIDLEQVSTRELLAELRSRRHVGDIIGLSTEEMICELEELGVPKAILAQLAEWSRQPPADVKALQQWVAACSINPPLEALCSL